MLLKKIIKGKYW